MIITNFNKGKAYQLNPDAQLTVERPNPFLNEYGEQTIPLDIPASDYNNDLLDHPELIGHRKKMLEADVSIQDGTFYASCRQAILSAQRKGSISTSFYLNDGSLYSRLQNVPLKTVFDTQEDKITFTGSTVAARIQSAIAWCRQLRNNQNERFTIFPVLVTDDSGQTDGWDYKVLNAFGAETTLYAKKTQYENESGEPTTVEVPVLETGDFFGSKDRVEYVSGQPIKISAGYYISPFIRTNYVLKRLFRYFGYELQSNFFTETSPFDKMVLLNPVIDTLANGDFYVADILPDVSCTDLLNVFRKKFCCEFVPDEEQRTVSLVFMKDVADMPATSNLTPYLTEEPTVNYKTKKSYGRVVISAKNTVGSNAEESYDDLQKMAAGSPSAFLDVATGAFFKKGYGMDFRTTRNLGPWATSINIFKYILNIKIGEGSQSYNIGGTEGEIKIDIAETIPEFRKLRYSWMKNTETYYALAGLNLYVGDYKTINSKIKQPGNDDNEEAEGKNSFDVMMAFSFSNNGVAGGTISAYDPNHPNLFGAYRTGGYTNPPTDYEPTPFNGYVRLFDYALYYNGEDGIFNRFYKGYDTLNRNALQETKVKLLLPAELKRSLSSWQPVSLLGEKFFPDKIKFTIGGKDAPIESVLRTAWLSEPISIARQLSELLPTQSSLYGWEIHIDDTEVSKAEYDQNKEFQEINLVTSYPPVASEDLLGTEACRQYTYIEFGPEWPLRQGMTISYHRFDFYLVCVHL